MHVLERASANQKVGFHRQYPKNFTSQLYILTLVFNDRKPAILEVLVPPICITAKVSL